MKTDLTAVQAEIRAGDYVSESAFLEAMDSYMEQARRLWNGDTHIVVFPEFLPTLLYPGLFNGKGIVNSSVGKNLLNFVARNITLLHGPNPLKGAFIERAPEIERIYVSTFSGLALKNHSYIIAPSVLLPVIDNESAMGKHIRTRRLFNTSYLFNPLGCIVGKFKKKQLTASENRLLFSPSDESYPAAANISPCKIGVAICYDMFFENTVAGLDSVGTEVVAVPSCNFGEWKGGLSYRPGFTQEQIWFRDGPYRATAARENIRYLVNPMAVGRVGSDIAQGRSSIWSRGRALKISRHWDRSEVINLTVEI